MNSPLQLPYAPRRSRPLSLWNLLDYLLLLYWVFFFPQALRWYIEAFGRMPAQTDIRQAVRQHKVERHLAIQGVVLTVIAPLAVAYLFTRAGIEVDKFGVAVGVAGGVVVLRLDVVLPIGIIALFQPSKCLAIQLQRVSPIPIFQLRRSLAQQLEADWMQGLHECEGLLCYTLQFIPVIDAIHHVLGHMPHNLLLQRLAAWCSMSLYDWNVVFFQSASLRAGLFKECWEGFFIIPRRWRPVLRVAPRYDTPVRAATAGFWHLYEHEAGEASTAFAAVQHLPNGEELYANAVAFADAVKCQSLADIADWKPPAQVVGEPLRPQVRAMFAEFARVAQDVALVQQSRSARLRNSALNRASGALSPLPARMHDCPSPERCLFEEVAERRLKIVLASATAVGTLEVRRPVASPYIVGAPVPAERLVGRADIFEQIQAMWAKSGQRDSLVMFGHRRMGKSSIVRNLLHFCPFPEDTGLAVLNLQTIDWEQGINDLCYAMAFELWKAAPVDLTEPSPEAYQQQPLTALRRLLANLDRLRGQRRYILILDEYELLDVELPPETASALLTMLRGFTQQYPWLVMALVGLHALEERSASFYEAIYTWRQLKLGLLGADAVADMLQVEDDSFPLEYTPEATARAYQLTGGQPFLVQLLGDSLVQRFNQRLRQELDPPPPIFSAEDVDAVVADKQFYQQGDGYFRGIWEQAGESPHGQHALLQALASRADGLDQSQLQHVSGLDDKSFQDALAALRRHDVVVCEQGICRYTVELMRRWVQGGAISPP